MSANVCFAPQRYSFLLNISTPPPEILINDKKIIIIAIVFDYFNKNDILQPRNYDYNLFFSVTTPLSLAWDKHGISRGYKNHIVIT